VLLDDRDIGSRFIRLIEQRDRPAEVASPPQRPAERILEESDLSRRIVAFQPESDGAGEHLDGAAQRGPLLRVMVSGQVQ